MYIKQFIGDYQYSKFHEHPHLIPLCALFVNLLTLEIISNLLEVKTGNL